jgi:protein O-mannosyl-transferase
MKKWLLITLTGILVFGNTLSNKFVWDDRTFIQFNPDIHRLNIGYLLGANMFNNINAGQYRFFVALYFTVLHILYGDNSIGYHVIQIFIHIANTFLLFNLFKRFFSKIVSLCMSMVFLVHPIQVESVSYIASSGNPLFTLFGLLALTLKNDYFVFSCLLLSLLSKETGFLFVILVILNKFNLKRLIYGLITILVYFFIRFGIAGVYFSKVTLAPITRLMFWERILNVPAVIFYYFKTFFYPKTLIIEQYWTIQKPNIDNFFLPLIFCLILSIFIILLGIYIKKYNYKLLKVWVFFGVWLVLGLGMYSQVFSLDMTVADRWFYFPIIGLLGLLALIWEIWLIGKTKIATIVFSALIVGLSIRTMVRNTNWKDPITLYKHDTQLMENYDLENSLGAELNMTGQNEEAIVHFEKSVNIFPHETNLFNLGLAYEGLGKLDLAEKYYQQALQSNRYGEVPKPHVHHSVTYERLGILLLKKDFIQSLKVVNMGLTDYPNSAQLWYTKALGEYKNSNFQEALLASKNAYILLPDNTNTRELYLQLSQNKKININ